MKLWKIPTVTLAAAALVVVAAPGASAATDCDGDLADAAITGDLLVPAGATCTLGGATVSGSIIVDDDGWLDATSTEVGGDVVGIDTYGISLDDVSVAGDVVSFSEPGRYGFLYIHDSAVAGSVETGGIDVEVSDSTVGGILNAVDSTYVDLLRVSIDGDVTIAGAPYGVNVAGVVTNGSLAVTDSGRDVLIGATADGGADTWGNTVGGELVLAGNTGNVHVAGTSALGGFVLDENVNQGPGNSEGVEDGDQSVVVIVPERNPGEFIWSIESDALINLGVAEENGDHFVASGSINNVRVTDTRIVEAPWAINGVITDFASGETAEDGSYFGWTPEVVEAGAGAVAGAHVASGFDEGSGLSESRTLGSAEAGHDLGSAVLGADLELKLPVTVETGTYNATLTLTALS